MISGFAQRRRDVPPAPFHTSLVPAWFLRDGMLLAVRTRVCHTEKSKRRENGGRNAMGLRRSRYDCQAAKDGGSA